MVKHENREIGCVTGASPRLQHALSFGPRIGKFSGKSFRRYVLADLTKAMGINRPSLYATFGIVGELFRKAAGRYHDGTAAHPRQALEEVTARTVVKRLLYGIVELLTDTRTLQGCLTIQAAGGARRKESREMTPSQSIPF